MQYIFSEETIKALIDHYGFSLSEWQSIPLPVRAKLQKAMDRQASLKESLCDLGAAIENGDCEEISNLWVFQAAPKIQAI